MSKARFFIGTAVVICLTLFGSAAPAFAEFESKVKESDKGTGEIFETAVEAGGAKVTCQALEAGASNVGWTVVKSGKPSAKGPVLQINISKWGECEAAKPIEGPAKITACELEIEQPGEQTKLSGKIVKTCTIETTGGCTIKMEPKNNSGLKAVYVGTPPGSKEDTAFGPEISNLVTEVSKVSKSCTGIEAAKAAKLTGLGELYSVQNPAPVLMFTPFAGGMFNETSAANNVGNLSFLFFGNITGFTEFICTEAKMTGSLSAVAPTINVIPEYGGCTATGFEAGATVTVMVTHCAYRYTLLGRTGTPGESSGRFQLINNGGTCEIKLAATENNESCKIIVKSQANPTGVTRYTNEAGLTLKLNDVSRVSFEVNDPTKCTGGFFMGFTYSDGYIGTGANPSQYKLNNLRV